MGYPLNHTRSPAIHRRFLREAGRRGEYAVYPFDPRRGKRAFFAFLDGLRERGVLGLNVTVPFKQWAHEYAIKRGASRSGGSFHARCARIAGAANTLIFRKTVGCANTDSAGLWDDLGEWLDRKLPASERVALLIVGTGGAARGSIAGLVAGHPVARRVARARVWGRAPRAAARLNKLCGAVSGSSDSGLKSENLPVLVLFCLPPVGKRAARAIWRALRLPEGKRYLYDLNYGPRADSTRGLVPDGRRRTGAGMLRNQATASFGLWLGILP